MSVRIPLHGKGGTIRAYAIVDEADAPKLIGHRWHITVSAGRTYPQYAARCDWRGRRNYLMHREIMGLFAGDGKLIDHVNGDGLDNRRSNLRLTSTQGNIQNQKVRRDSKTGIRGVTWSKSAKKWRADVCVNGKQISLGRFDQIEEAARVVAAKRKELGFLGSEAA